MSAYFDATREEYYAHLLAVTEKGEWEEWLASFLRGVTQQSEDALGRIQRIDDLLRAHPGELGDVADRDSLDPAFLDQVERSPPEPVAHPRGPGIGAVGTGGRPRNSVR